MTAHDRSSLLEGYYKSHWPVECGGNRRQKATKGSLNASEKKAVVQLSLIHISEPTRR